MKKKLTRGTPLKPVLITGFILVLIISFAMAFFASAGRGESSPEAATFTAELRLYDLFDAPKRVLEGENPAQIEARLSRLQRLAGSVEEQLSVLKRRRALAQIDRRYIPSYEKAAREAAEVYAYSSPIAAVAAEALLLDGPPLGEDLERLRSYGSRVSQSRFGLLELGIDFFSGDLEDPARAAALPGIDGLLSGDYPGLPDQIRRNILLDDFLLHSYRRDVSGATQSLNALLDVSESMLTALMPPALIPVEITRLAAEFYYDYNNPLRAAELFLALAGENDLARAADSLFLAGEISGARNIWFALSSGNINTGTIAGSVARQADIPLRMRSYYNLAATAATSEEESYWLEQSFSAANFAARSSPSGPSVMDRTRLFSALRYSRLLDTDTAIATLDDLREEPLLDLESLRREIDSLPPTRATAEVWLLLSRHPSNEALYEWAAWYFDFKQLYSETDRLLLEASRKGMYGTWFVLHQALALLRDGKTDAGEKILKEAAQGSSPDWRIFANLGRIYESRRSISTALGYYENAATLIPENKLQMDRASAAQLQMRLSRCLEALGRTEEGRRAIEYAHELDPENINIRRELRRVSGN